MTRDDICQLYEKANGWSPKSFIHTTDELEKFVALVTAAKEESMIADGWRQCAKGQRTTQFCGAAEQARSDEREACAQIAWDRFGTAGREIAGAIRKKGNK